MGDKVYAYNFDSKKVVERKIEKLLPHFTYHWVDVTIGGEKITSTRAHRFWVEDSHQWLEAAKLKPGMEVRLDNGKQAKVESVVVRDLAKPEATYNIEVENDHDYFVGSLGVLVHNGISTDLDIRFHHAYPKYLGGAEDQLLEPVPTEMHYEYHAALDEVLPRSEGTAYYAARTGAERDADIEAFKQVTQDFDAKNGTSFWEAAQREGCP